MATTKKATTTKKPAAAPKAAKADPQAELASKRAELLEARRSHRAGELVNPRVLRERRKDIARALTAINAKKETK